MFPSDTAQVRSLSASYSPRTETSRDSQLSKSCGGASEVPTGDVLYREVMGGKRPVPRLGEAVQRTENEWKCLNCSALNLLAALQCPCGYRELSLIHASSDQFSAVTGEIYWTCSCGFSLNTYNGDACRACHLPNPTLHAKRLKKQEDRLAASRSLYQHCHCF